MDSPPVNLRQPLPLSRIKIRRQRSLETNCLEAAFQRTNQHRAVQAEAEQLDYALDTLVPFAHWITPEAMPKRFDTWFFLARAPEGQIGLHDGAESVESEWIGAQAALDEWEAKRRVIVFATRMQLVKLARAASVDAALANAAAEPIVDVMPVLDRTSFAEPHLRIPAEAGYGVTEVPLSRVGM